MGLVSDTLPNLVNGVSQQPPTQRLPSQGEEQINGYSSIVEGLKKRSPTSHLAKLLSGTAGDVFVHVINRDVDERYILLVIAGVARVFTLAGVEKAISGDMTYLNVAAPQRTSQNLQAITIADYTFIVNRTITTRTVPRGASFVVRFPNLTIGDMLLIQINSLEWRSVVVASGDNPTSIAEGFAGTTWWDPALYTVTRSGDELTITGMGAQLNTEFSLKVQIYPGTAVINSASVVSTPPKSQEALVYVKQGNYSINYIVSLFEAGTTAAYTFTYTTSATDPTTIRTEAIAAALKAGLDALAGFTTDYTATVNGSLLRIVRTSGGVVSFSVVAQDSNGDRNMVAIMGRIQKFVDLPTKAFDGLVVKIEGDTSSESDDYYVKFAINNNGSGAVFGAGTWSEYRQSGTGHSFDPTTMPHTLVRQADGTFVFAPGGWTERLVGDDESNEAPSFVNKKITEVFFHRNRLGFLSDENEILSEAGSYFNFWRTTVQSVLDGDPIDLSAANQKVSLLRHAASFDEKLILMSDQQQFLAGAGDLLTVKTATIKPTTAFEITGRAAPVSSGTSVYFPVPRGEFTGIREYMTNKDTLKDDALDIMAHVPAYLPNTVYHLTATANEQVLACFTDGDPNAIYIYKFYIFNDGSKIQASWSKWEISANATILGGQFLTSSLYLVVQREDGVYLESLPVDVRRQDVNFDYEVLLDRKTTNTACSSVTYNSTTDLTTWVLPYQTAEALQMIVRQATSPYKLGQRVIVTKATSNTNTVTAIGNFASVPVFIGVPYRFEYVMSELIPRSASPTAVKPITGGRLQVRTIGFVFEQSGYFRVEVTARYRDTTTTIMTDHVLGQTVIGTQGLRSGTLRVPVQSKSDQVTIKVVNDSHMPSRIMSAVWEGEFTLRSKRL